MKGIINQLIVRTC